MQKSTMTRAKRLKRDTIRQVCAFALLGTGLGLGLGVIAYHAYGLDGLIVFQGLCAYGTLGLLLGIWHGWLTGWRWRIWKKVVLALVGSIMLAFLWVVFVDTRVSHATLSDGVQAAMVAVSYKWFDAMIVILAAGLLLTKRRAPDSHASSHTEAV